MEIESKLPDVGVTIFTVMSQQASDHGAINLSQGFPDFDPDPDLCRRVDHHLQNGRNQYAPMAGVPALREKIAQKTREIYGAAYDPDKEITVTAGATEAIFAAITAAVSPGDEVIVLEPAYDAYVPVIRLNGGRPVFVQLTFPDYRIDWDRLRDALTPRTRMLILNSPHNPTGAVLSAADMAALTEIVAERPLLILSDEVYEHIVFDGARHESMARYPALAGRSFVISSFGKTYHTTGWKVGYCLAPAPLSREFQKVHQYLTFAVNTPVQCAYADFLDRRSAYGDLPGFYQKKRDLFQKLVAGSRFRVLPCRGTYFQMLGYSAIADEPDTDFARRITTEHGGRGHSALGLLPRRHRPPGAAVLFCQKRRDPGRRRGEAMPDLTVTLVQAELAWEDPEANRRALAETIAAMDAPADLIVLPEMFTTGFSMNAAPLAETMDGPTVAWVQETARTSGADVTGSFIAKENGRFFNRLVWARPDGTLFTYDKRHLFRMLGEEKIYSAGDRLLTVEINGWRIRPFICYDLRFPAWSRNLDNAYDLAVYIANWPARRAGHWQALLAGRAIENQCYVVGVNRVGVDGNGLSYSGDSSVIDPAGEILFSQSSIPAIHTQTLSKEILDTWRRDFPAWRDADDGLISLPA